MIKKSLPNFITCLNLTCGLLAIFSNDLKLGVFLIILGGIFDVFDGLLARALKVSSSIGKELDSLADIVSFGVAPAVLYYKAFAFEGQWWYLLGPIFLVVAGALRLARFNTTESSSTYFEGLAIPASGLMVCGLVYASEEVNLNFLLFIIIALSLASLNISSIKMFSFKQFGMAKVKVYFGIVVLAVIASLFFVPFLSLTVGLGVYILLAIMNSFTPVD